MKSIELEEKNHNIGSYKTNKISLSFNDDKNYILEDGYSRL